MKKIIAMILVMLMVVAMIASCTDDEGPVVGGTPPTYGEISIPTEEETPEPSQSETWGSGGVIELPMDPFED